MTRLLPSVSAVALLTIDLAPVLHLEMPRTPFDHLHLAGAGVVTHHTHDDGRMSFALQAYAVSAGSGEGAVVDWLEDELTARTTIAAYGLYDHALPLLRSLVEPARHLDLAALAVAPTTRFDDLTERLTSGVPVRFDDACRRASIPCVPLDPDQAQSWWATGNTAAMRAMLEQQAIATWRLWLARQAARNNNARLERSAVEQLGAWLARRPAGFDLRDHDVTKPIAE